jgi:hypothetical protein
MVDTKLPCHSTEYNDHVSAASLIRSGHVRSARQNDGLYAADDNVIRTPLVGESVLACSLSRPGSWGLVP